MELRRRAGLRKLPDPRGPKAAPKGPRYLVAHACFPCRLSFKRAAREDGTLPQCPSCAKPLAEMGRGFKAPLRKDLERWKVVEFLHEAGFRFPSTARRATPSLPTKLRDAVAFVAENPSHPYRASAT